MILQMYFLSEWFITLCTGIAPSIRVVCSDMLLYIRWAAEPFSTHITHMRLLSTVTPTVFHQCRSTWKCRTLRVKLDVLSTSGNYVGRTCQQLKWFESYHLGTETHRQTCVKLLHTVLAGSKYCFRDTQHYIQPKYLVHLYRLILRDIRRCVVKKQDTQTRKLTGGRTIEALGILVTSVRTRFVV